MLLKSRGFPLAVQDEDNKNDDTEGLDDDGLPPGWDAEDVVSDDAIRQALEETHAATAALTPPPIVPPSAPPAEDWEVVSRRVKQDVDQWISSSRGRSGALLVLKPSPSTGKTHSMIQAAVDERANGRNVGYAIFSKDQLPETVDRFMRAAPAVRLHVLHGRDATNCYEWTTVQAAQRAGYSPGGAVCLRCPYYPKAKALPPCGYYESRIRAARDYQRSRHTGQPYPIILTTHGAAVQAQFLDTHEYGTFWNFDTLFFDEDPSAAFDASVEVTDAQLTYEKNNDIPTWMTTLLRESLAQAHEERALAELRHFRDPISGGEDRIHTKWGSAFVSDDLHALLERAFLRPAFNPIRSGIISDARTLIVQTINDSDDMKLEPGAMASMSEYAIAHEYPHRALVPIAESIEAEIQLIEADRRAGLSTRFAYLTRLECHASEDADTPTTIQDWKLIRTAYTTYKKADVNIVIGDAYSDVSHYEAVFDRSSDVVDHRAKWPSDVIMIRDLCHASRRDVSANPSLFFTNHLRPILEAERGRAVLFYLHKRFKSDLEDWLTDPDNDFGLKDMAVEHFASGRGKDVYRHFDTFVSVSEYIPNVGGLIHEANARAFLSAKKITDKLRVEHWQSGASARRGSQTFGSSYASMDPRLLPIFQRKCVEELAQAVHRIRPAMPVTSSESSKRVWILGHNVPLTEELLTATTTLGIDDSAGTSTTPTGLTYTVLPGPDSDRGKLLTLREGPLTLVSAYEMAAAMGSIYAHFGCWSPIFSHALLGLTFDGDFQQLQTMLRSGHVPSDPPDVPVNGERITEDSCVCSETLYKQPQQSQTTMAMARTDTAGRLYSRVWSPPVVWEDISNRITRLSRRYWAAYELFLQALPAPVTQGRVKRPWMPPRSKGREYVGDLGKFLQIIDQYGPQDPTMPF